jgi:hypothetical protein
VKLGKNYSGINWAERRKKILHITPLCDVQAFADLVNKRRDATNPPRFGHDI